MLVLSRKECERVNIGTAITITVVEIRGNRVRLGFEAPEDVPIAREELQTLEFRQHGFIDVDKLVDGARQAGVCAGLAMQLDCVAANCEGDFGDLLRTVVDRLDASENAHFREPKEV